MKPLLVLCLGNEILADDAFGFHVAETFSNEHGLNDNTEIIFAPIAGFSLLDVLANRTAALIVDTIITGNREPGHLHYFKIGYDAATTTLVSSHQISLPVALQFGRKLGLEMPKNISVLAVEASDIYTLSQTMTGAVKDSVTKAVLHIDDWIRVNESELFVKERDNF
jgi:hydrogenase maturation protease